MVEVNTYQVVEAAQPSADYKGPNEVIAETKQYRVDLDAVLQRLKADVRKSRERSLVITKLQESIMWLGMDLKAMKEEGLSDAPNPYPNSYNPSNAIVDPTADGLKL